jgi:hypothetical protein
MKNSIIQIALYFVLCLNVDPQLLESDHFPVTFDWQSFIVRVIKKQMLTSIESQTAKDKKKPH